jgi:acetyltransferase-like isoleucine patch superfamily enzyme
MAADFQAHPLALVETESVGSGTRVWAWAHLMPGAVVGAQCNIGEHCFVESGARLGDRVTVKNGVAVWDGLTIEDDVFLGPAAVLTNDPRPRSRSADFVPTATLLRRGCSIGANATVLCGLTIGRHALVGAGAVVTRDVPDHVLVVGNPARPVGHVCRCAATLSFDGDEAICACGARFRRDGGTLHPLD